MIDEKQNLLRGDAVAKISPESLSNPGPKNPSGSSLAPSSEIPPATDRGDVPNFWFPFSRAKKRIQVGGWARQVNVNSLPLATTLAGVNMRLIAGAIREIHWHQASEWAIMLYGNARITAIDSQNRCFVKDVKEGDLWFFPAGFPHSIQGLGPDGCEFLLVFDDGNFSEDATFLLTDWFSHTPKEVLSKNFGWPEAAFEKIPQKPLYIFPEKIPESLENDLKSAEGPEGTVPLSYVHSLYNQTPDVETKSGNARIVDSHNFPISTTISAALVTVHPGGMRELHWHPNADEWLYFISGKGRVTLFTGVERSRTMDFNAGDVGSIPKAAGHYIENTGDEDLRFLEMFQSSYFADLSLSAWMGLTPSEMVKAHTHLDKERLNSLPKKKLGIVPSD